MTDKAASQAEETKAAAAAVAASEPGDLGGFGDGDLGRLQGILFGDHAKKTQERIDTLERALLGALADLKDQFSVQVAELAGQIAAEAETRATAIANLSDRIASESKSAATENRALKKSVDKSIEKLTLGMDGAAEEGRIELDATRRDLTAQIETVEAALLDSSVNRGQLADLLSAMATELKQ